MKLRKYSRRQWKDKTKKIQEKYKISKFIEILYWQPMFIMLLYTQKNKKHGSVQERQLLHACAGDSGTNATDQVRTAG